MIYVIYDKHNDLVKIGKTICPVGRWRIFQVQHPWDLVIIRLMEGDKEEEKFLHNKWDHLRMRGEWFQYHPDMLSDKTFPDCDVREVCFNYRKRSKWHEKRRIEELEEALSYLKGRELMEKHERESKK